MRIRVHADDFGVSRGVSDAILQCIDEGPVEGTSIIANGAAFDYAVAALRARPRVAISVHLNLIEGQPVIFGEDHRDLAALEAQVDRARQVGDGRHHLGGLSGVGHVDDGHAGPPGLETPGMKPMMRTGRCG